MILLLVRLGSSDAVLANGCDSAHGGKHVLACNCFGKSAAAASAAAGAAAGAAADVAAGATAGAGADAGAVNLLVRVRTLACVFVASAILKAVKYRHCDARRAGVIVEVFGEAVGAASD